MDINKSADLSLVADDFEEGEHEKQDEDIHRLFLQINSTSDQVILAYIIVKLGDRANPKYRDLIQRLTLIDNNPSFKDMLYAGWKNGFKNVRLLSKDWSWSVDCMSNAHYDRTSSLSIQGCTDSEII
jgi:hypothetical protein